MIITPVPSSIPSPLVPAHALSIRPQTRRVIDRRWSAWEPSLRASCLRYSSDAAFASAYLSRLRAIHSARMAFILPLHIRYWRNADADDPRITDSQFHSRIAHLLANRKGRRSNSAYR